MSTTNENAIQVWNQAIDTATHNRRVKLQHADELKAEAETEYNTAIAEAQRVWNESTKIEPEKVISEVKQTCDTCRYNTHPASGMCIPPQGGCPIKAESK